MSKLREQKRLGEQKEGAKQKKTPICLNQIEVAININSYITSKMVILLQIVTRPVFSRSARKDDLIEVRRVFPCPNRFINRYEEKNTSLL